MKLFLILFIFICNLYSCSFDKIKELKVLTLEEEILQLSSLNLDFDYEVFTKNYYTFTESLSNEDLINLFVFISARIKNNCSEVDSMKKEGDKIDKILDKKSNEISTVTSSGFIKEVYLKEKDFDKNIKNFIDKIIEKDFISSRKIIKDSEQSKNFSNLVKFFCGM